MFQKNTKYITYLLILIVAFLLLFVRSNVFSPLKFFVIKTSFLPLRIISFPFREIKKILYYRKTFNEYMRLRREVDVLRGRLVGYKEVVRENARLEKLLDFKRNLVFSSVAANVIGRDPSNWNAAIVIDKGSEDNILPGMPVINGMGVVGKVSEVGSNMAKVVLLTDPSFSVPALTERSREVGLISGTLMGVCRMRYLSSKADIRKGDVVLTSKLSTSFPEGLLVGEVIEVHSSERSPTINCIIKPAVPLSQIEEVLVIQNQ